MNKMDSLLQVKQASLENSPTNVIPTVTTVILSTLETSLAPIPPMATTLSASTPSTSATRSTTIVSTGDEASRLVKTMEYMSIHTTEINKLKERVTSLETDYRQKVTRMNERIKSQEKELTLK